MPSTVELNTLQQRSGVAGVGQAVPAALPKFMAAMRSYDDSADPALRIIGLGSSVGVGATLPDAATQAPSAYFFNKISAAFNRLGNLNLTHTNGAVNGSIITDGNLTSYAAAKTAAGGTPTIALLAYGMNDAGQYYSGQTYPGVYTALVALCQSIIRDGGDPVLCTTPHPHTGRYPWTGFSGGFTYPPGGVRIPAATVEAQVISGDWSETGVTIPASYIYKRTNDAIRQVGFDLGIPVLDVEKYWFRAVALFGEDALFNTGEYVHPNLLGHQQSYWRAIDDFVAGLSQANVAFSLRQPSVVTARKLNNSTRVNTTALSNDSELVFDMAANEVWKVDYDVFFTAPTANDLKVGIDLPSGAVGTFGVHGPANDASTFDTHPFIGRASGIAGGSLQMGGIGADSFGKITALIVNGSTPGTVSLQFAQATAGGTTTIYSRSHLVARRMS